MATKKDERFYLRDIPLESLIERVRELSLREQEVFALLATYLNTEGLAECLGVSEGSMKQYQSRIIKKVLKPLVPRVDAFNKRVALMLLSERYQEMRRSLANDLRSLCGLHDEREAALAEVNLWINQKQDLLDKVPSLPLPTAPYIGGWHF